MEARHSRMNNKYLADAKKLLQQGDYLQASEKYWGAAVQMIKVIAARRGLYTRANNLHMNFYEDHVPPEKVKEDSEAVKELIEKLQHIQ